MINGVRANLEICKNCRYLVQRMSRRVRGASFFYCHVAYPMKKKVASIRPEKSLFQHIPNECAFRLEHIVSQKRNE